MPTKRFLNIPVHSCWNNLVDCDALDQIVVIEENCKGRFSDMRRSSMVELEIDVEYSDIQIELQSSADLKTNLVELMNLISSDGKTDVLIPSLKILWHEEIERYSKYGIPMKPLLDRHERIEDEFPIFDKRHSTSKKSGITKKSSFGNLVDDGNLADNDTDGTDCTEPDASPNALKPTVPKSNVPKSNVPKSNVQKSNGQEILPTQRQESEGEKDTEIQEDENKDRHPQWNKKQSQSSRQKRKSIKLTQSQECLIFPLSKTPPIGFHYSNLENVPRKHIDMITPIFPPESVFTIKKMKKKTCVTKRRSSVNQATQRPPGRRRSSVALNNSFPEIFAYGIPPPTVTDVLNEIRVNVSRNEEELLKVPVTLDNNGVLAPNYSIKKVSRRTSFGQSQLSQPGAFMNTLPASKEIFSSVKSGTSMFVEILSEIQAPDPTGTLRDFTQDKILAIFYVLRDERRTMAAKLSSRDVCSDPNGLLAICSGSQETNELSRICILSNIDFQPLPDEHSLLWAFSSLLTKFDPLIIYGFDTTRGSIGYICRRASAIGLKHFVRLLSRNNLDVRAQKEAAAVKKNFFDRSPESPVENEEFGVSSASDSDHAYASSSTGSEGPSKMQSSYKKTDRSRHTFSFCGRILLPIQTLLLSSLKLRGTSAGHIAAETLGLLMPQIPPLVLWHWWVTQTVPGKLHLYRHVAIKYMIAFMKTTIKALDCSGIIPRSIETASVLGLDLPSILWRGSQYKVEAVMIRCTRKLGYVMPSPKREETLRQRASTAGPMTLEPVSGFHWQPVSVLDFQSLYPSIIIAYNICYTTCLGLLSDVLKAQVSCISFKLGVSNQFHFNWNEIAEKGGLDSCNIMANGCVFVKKEIRSGVLPQMLEEILQTRKQIKQGIKIELDESQKNALVHRQHSLKMIANTTFGYVNAHFTGRLPCVEVADAIVQTSRHTLLNTICLLKDSTFQKKLSGSEMKPVQVIYGDTDSIFVKMDFGSQSNKIELSRELSSRIATEITKRNPYPIELIFEKTYLPCTLVTKKRYAGLKYDRQGQVDPDFEAKGLEVVRRDVPTLTSIALRNMLQLAYLTKGDLSKMMFEYLKMTNKVLQGRIGGQDLVILRKYRDLNRYSKSIAKGKFGSLPPQAVLSIRKLAEDSRDRSIEGERIPLLFACALNDSRVSEMVVRPEACEASWGPVFAFIPQTGADFVLKTPNTKFFESKQKFSHWPPTAENIKVMLLEQRKRIGGFYRLNYRRYLESFLDSQIQRTLGSGDLLTTNPPGITIDIQQWSASIHSTKIVHPLDLSQRKSISGAPNQVNTENRGHTAASSLQKKLKSVVQSGGLLVDSSNCSTCLKSIKASAKKYFLQQSQLDWDGDYNSESPILVCESCSLNPRDAVVRGLLRLRFHEKREEAQKKICMNCTKGCVEISNACNAAIHCPIFFLRTRTANRLRRLRRQLGCLCSFTV
eukprot:GHVP01022838.1.p1 GENE.GHVP01022838.1~~GHVP01022838.1.p1  ORF type:complete len:1605 (+),score=275.20 GHVP01022838.1:463-4815(+)